MGGFRGVGEKCVPAKWSAVNAMAADTKGNLYLASSVDVLKIAPGGVVSTIAGSAATGNSPDGGLAINALFQSVSGVAVGASGNVYGSDTQANRVPEISPINRTLAPFARYRKAGLH